MKKKLLVLALALAMVFSLAGCLQLEKVESISLVESPSATYNYGDPSQEFNFSIAVEKEDTYLVRFNATAAELNNGPVTQNGVTVTGFNVMSYGTRTATISYGTAASIQFEYTVNVNYSAGEGTVADPYQIQDAEQMAYMLAEDSAEGKNFKLIADIDFSAMDMNLYTETLEANPVFTGTFDGDGHAIKNFVNTNAIDGLSHGLFFKLQNATIRNIDFVNSIVDTYGEGGGLLGYGYKNNDGANTIVIENVDVKEDNGVSYVAGWKNTGAYVGYVGDNVNFTIKNCVNDADVMVYNGYGAAGFVGTIRNGGGKIVFENCTNNGDIVGSQFVGALAGNGSSFKNKGATEIVTANCTNNGNLTYTQTVNFNYATLFLGCSNLNMAEWTKTSCVNNGSVVMVAGQEVEASYEAAPAKTWSTITVNVGTEDGAITFTSAEADYYIVSVQFSVSDAKGSTSGANAIFEVNATSGNVKVPATIKVGEKTYTTNYNNGNAVTLDGANLGNSNKYKVVVSAYIKNNEGMDQLVAVGTTDYITAKVA